RRARTLLALTTWLSSGSETCSSEGGFKRRSVCSSWVCRAHWRRSRSSYRSRTWPSATACVSRVSCGTRPISSRHMREPASAKRRVDAREHLRSAIELFDGLGAAPWSEQARRELRASGASIPRRDPTAPEKLTPQELQIALQVAEGRTNRDVAAALFLSPKT